jgi:predicted permease
MKNKLAELGRRLMALFHREQFDADLEEEMRLHQELREEEQVKRGVSPEEAHYAARRRFGSKLVLREESREMWGWKWLETVLQDVRYGLRQLRRNPGFTVVAVITLALGIGANTAIFSLVNAILLKDLPVKDPQELARIVAYRKEEPRDLSYPIFRDLFLSQHAFVGLAASGLFTPDQVTIGGPAALRELAHVSASLVSANYFSVLGVKTAIGRLFTPEDSHVPGEGDVAVISFGFWDRQFGRDPGVLGRTLTVNRIPFTIIGVTRRSFFGDQVGEAPDLWIPILMQPRLQSRNMLERRTATWFRTLARLRPGGSKNQAQAELTLLFRHLMAEEIANGSGSLISQGKPSDFRIEVQAGSSGLNALEALFSQPLRLLMGVVSLVLLIACCNVANLLLARSAARQKEITARIALGAGRNRLIRQLLTESLLLASMGGALGLLAAWWGKNLLASLASLSIDLQPDTHVLVFTACVSLASAIVFGVIPALRATSINIGPSLQLTWHGQRSSRPKQRLSKGLVVSQVGLSLCLLTGAGLLVRSLQNLRNQNIGFVRDNVLTLEVFADPKTISGAQLPGLQRQLLERLKAIPGVRSVSSSAFGLFSGSVDTSPVRVPGSSVNPQRDPDVWENWVSTDYFRTVGMKLQLGREFTDQDSKAATKVAVINQTMARHYFGDGNPIGRMIYFPKTDAQGRYIPFGARLNNAQAVDVVGVVKDAKYDDLREATPPMAYLPIAQADGFPASIEIRTSKNPKLVAPLIRPLLRDINADLILRNVATLEEQIDDTLTQERLLTKLVGLFGLLALGLACVGLYGVMSYSVARRAGEFGIRMALGAQKRDVVKLVVGQGMILAVTGVGIGIVGALGLTRFLSSLLYGVKPNDPLTFVAVSFVLIGVALLACYIPTRRATNVDPMVALRYE